MFNIGDRVEITLTVTNGKAKLENGDVVQYQAHLMFGEPYIYHTNSDIALAVLDGVERLTGTVVGFDNDGELVLVNVDDADQIKTVGWIVDAEHGNLNVDFTRFGVYTLESWHSSFGVSIDQTGAIRLHADRNVINKI